MDIGSLIPAGLQTNQLETNSISAGYNKLSENLRKFTPLALQCAIFCGGSRCKYENSKAWLPVHMAIKDIFSHCLLLQFRMEGLWVRHHGETFGYGQGRSLCGSRRKSRNSLSCRSNLFSGLGRTGVLIACYLIYSLRVRSSDAIRFVRMKRPSAIQTRGQILCIQEFEHFVLPQMVVFPKSNKPCSLQSYLKGQYNVLHGYEQRTFKHIPKIIFAICERILQLCDCQEDNSPAEIDYKVSYTPFTHRFISHVLEKLSQKEEKMEHSYSWDDSLTDLSLDYLITSKNYNNFNGPVSSSETLNDITEDIFCTSPEAPSCSSAFPGLDDNCIDDVLSDGIRGQDLFDNNCYKEIQSNMNLKNAAETQVFTIVSANEAIKALLCNKETLSDEKKKKIYNYQIDLNTRSTAWQSLELETDLEILSSLLYEWMESLKKPILDTEALSQIVIRGFKPKQCLQKLDPWTRYMIEYLLRFVSRLRPLTNDSQSSLLKRLIASITQQKVRINHSIYPTGKNGQNLRNGTAGRVTEFLVRLLNLIEEINTKDMNTTWSSSKWEICHLLHESERVISKENSSS
ncbi:protein tyrosine phosphatase domain-containing protein 1-like isoform X4 [Belonocnema kinseyi]|uniref:protein tyrosine phosphatase domain-containing protein 1-like isoform X4 n=1 Tax=Belonocnema kinseyi TaxID=2817044 RepID=UPI00143CEBFA|nr:protein tyrosine phosphatase domain-containing protein 1-like isoform X4 [Belonocnema kinseyi]